MREDAQASEGNGKLDIAAKRDSTEKTLADLRLRQGEYILDGKGNSLQSQITQLENLLVALDQAEGIKARRERVAAEGVRLTRREQLRQEIKEAVQYRLEHLGAAEIALREFRRHVDAAHGLSRAIERRAVALQGRNTVGSVFGHEEEARRLCARMECIMAGVGHASGGHLGWWGRLYWTQHRLGYQPTDNWSECEERLAEKLVAELLKEDETDESRKNSVGAPQTSGGEC